MEKLKMQTENLADKNFEILSKIFPNALTETITGYDDDGKPIVERAIDADVLRQEISCKVVEGKDERYQFTWPDKKKAVLLANAPIDKTLRPCREESVDFDNTENLYIEGDNLEILKILQETYLEKVQMIYIDPPYNTGNDFLYADNFSETSKLYFSRSGQYDELGNHLVQNTEANGRYHTDWLNMFYPRVKIAKNLLTEDGVLMVSVDYNENYNVRSVLNEIFGERNFIGEIYWESKTKSQNTLTSYNKLQPKAEMILVYSKQEKRRFNLISKGEKEYPFCDERGKYREHALEPMNANGIRGRETMIFDISDGQNIVSLPEGKQWQIGIDQVNYYKQNKDLFIRDGKVYIKMRPDYERNEKTEPFWGFFSKDLGTAESAKKELNELIGNQHGFETVKPVEIIKRLVYHSTDKDGIVMDFFSGSATTAQAVLQLNNEDSGKRKYIMVQLPEIIDVDSKSYDAGYHTICDIGLDRICKVGSKINNKNVDTGFRLLKLDSSNMKDVYYNPADAQQSLFDTYADNIKEDRTPEDLLFQVMLDLGVLLSSKIEETTIAGKQVFNVADGFLIACFDKDVTEETVKAVAEKKPYYAVFRDSSMANDSVATNFDQIFASISPDTVRKVL